MCVLLHVTKAQRGGCSMVRQDVRQGGGRSVRDVWIEVSSIVGLGIAVKHKAVPELTRLYVAILLVKS